MTSPTSLIPSTTAALARGVPDELIYVAIAVSMAPPEESHPGWAESVCRELAAHEHPQVRANALLGFGHLARTAGVIWKPKEVRAAVEAGLVDPNPTVRGQAEAAAMDLRHFLGWKLKQPKS